MVIMQKKSRNLNLKFNINEALAVYQALSSIVYGNTLSADFNNAAKSALNKMKQAFINGRRDCESLSP